MRIATLAARAGRARREAVAWLVGTSLRGLSLAARLHPRARPGKHGVEVIRDLAYGPRLEHRLDVWRPRAPAVPLPVVLYMHGGGFRMLSKSTHWIMGLSFARRGYLVFNIDYRLAPAHPFPAAVEDACQAYRWIVENASRWGGDLSRLVVAGESAGANLATVLALCTCYERPEPWARAIFETDVVPRAVLASSGMLQVSDPGRFQRRKPRLPGWLGDRIRNVSEVYLGETPREGCELADPLLVLEKGEEPARPLPPFFAAVGTADPILDDTRRLAAALARLGTRCEARYYPGEVHAFVALVFREAARQCWEETFKFLDLHAAPRPA